MAQLKIRGLKDIYTISEPDALNVKQVWENDTYRPEHKMSIGALSFKKGDIQVIQMEGQDKFSDTRLNLGDPAQKQIVLDFEREYQEFRQGREGVFIYEQFLADKGIVRCEDEECRPARIIILKPHEFTEYNKKWSALNFLWVYRQEAGNKDMSELMKDKKALEGIFGEKEEINIADIPF